jgi:hypothetical protein
VKLTVMQENLARGLQVVSRAVSSRSTLPVLSNVLLRTEDAGLKLTATNLEIGITAWVPGKIDAEGALTVPARLLADVVAGLPAGERSSSSRGDTALRFAPAATRAPARHRRRGVPGHPRRPASGPRHGQARVTCTGAVGGRLRGRHRRGSADPDRRPDPLRATG